MSRRPSFVGERNSSGSTIDRPGPVPLLSFLRPKLIRVTDLSDAKIIVAMVGLPARGKSYLSNKLQRYLRVRSRLLLS